MLISFHLQNLDIIKDLGKGAIQEICALPAIRKCGRKHVVMPLPGPAETALS